jgi:hypothetical protein
MLYVIAERYPPAHKYRDVFDRIKTNVINAISHGDHETTRSTGILDNEVTEQARELDEGLTSTVRTDYSQIITDLAKSPRRLEPAAEIGSSDWQASSQVGDDGQAPRFDLSFLSGPMMEYSLGYAHGTFIDSAFMHMGNLENFNGLMNTDWELPNN